MPSNFKVLSGASGEPNDPNFKNVTLLLHGDGSNGAQNNTFIDSSTKNFTITRNGNTTQGSFSPYGSNWSNYFDGTGDYLTLGGETAFAFGTGDFTIEGWFFYQSTGALQLFLDFRPTSTDGVYPLLYIDTSGNVNYHVNGAVRITSSSVTQNSWNHFAVARSGTSTKLFINGTQAGSTYSDSNNYLVGASRPAIGSSGYSVGTLAFNGYLSNVRVVKGTAVYTSAFTPSTTPLTAITNTSLLTCAYNRFRDGSTNNFTITRNGDVKVTNFAPFAPSSAYSTSTNGGSAYFDGSGDYLTTSYTTANFDWWTSGVDYTLEYWFYANSLTGISYSDAGVNHSTVIGNRDAASTTDYWSFGPTSAGTVTFYYFASGAQSVTTTASFVINSWNHVAITKTSSGITLFVNGVAGTTTAIVNSPTSSTGTPLTIGQGNNTAFNGYVSNLRIVRGTAIYSGNFTPPTSPVTAVTNTKYLLNATNAAIFDNSMKNDLETVGNAQISTSVKKFGTGSMAFDGSGDYLVSPVNAENRINTTGNFTIEFWAYFNSVASNQRLIAWDNDANNFVIALYTNSSGSLSYYISSTGTSWDIAVQQSVGSISTGTWYHVALVRNGSTFTPYLNGVAGTSTTSSSTIYSSTLPFVIGATGTGTSPFNGYIDDLRITKGVARYTANFTPPTAAFPNK